jgi:pimeloyl-ACP methyl ester carboxylesterase
MRPMARFAFLIMAVVLSRQPVLLTQESVPLSELKTVIVADGVELHYADRGKGDAIIFVHGGMNDYTMWANQIGPFAEKYRVIAYSRRYNIPNTNKVQPNYSPLVDAEDLGTLIRKIDLGKVHVVGSSFGGRVALFFAAAHPDLVRTLVVQEAPIMFAGDRAPEAMAQNDRAMRLALDKGDREGAIQRIRDGISGGRATKFKELPADRQKWMLRNFEEMEAYHNNPVEPTIDRDAVRKITAPTLLLSGEQSPPLWKPIEAELLRLLPSWEHVVISGASHGMIRTHPEQTNAAIFKFLQGK